MEHRVNQQGFNHAAMRPGASFRTRFTAESQGPFLAKTVRSQPVPAVNDEHRAVDVASRVGTEEHRRVLNIFNQTEPAQRNLLSQPLFDCLRHEPLHAFGVFNWTRGDRVDANSMTPPFDGQVTSQGIDPGFGGRNVKLHWRTRVVQRGTDIKDLPLAFFEL